MLDNNTMFYLRLSAAVLVCCIAFSLENDSMLFGAMMISPIGSMIVDVATGRKEGMSLVTTVVLALVISFAVGFVSGRRNRITKSEHYSGRWELLIGKFVTAFVCGFLMPLVKEVPQVGLSMATQVVGPLSAIGYEFAMSARDRDPLSNIVKDSSSVSIILLTQMIGIYTSSALSKRLFPAHFAKSE